MLSSFAQKCAEHMDSLKLPAAESQWDSVDYPACTEANISKQGISLTLSRSRKDISSTRRRLDTDSVSSNHQVSVRDTHA